MNEKYEKIINLPHHVSEKHPPMSRLDRAAQFAPYSALSGYEDAVEETARLTDSKIELDEYEKEKINATLTDLIASPIGTKVKITFFRPDKRKKGGAYVTLLGEFDRVNEIERKILLVCGKEIKLDDITELRIIDIYRGF